MFKVLTSGPRRRVWSPATIAASIGAHVLVLAGAAYAVAKALIPPERAPDEISPERFRFTPASVGGTGVRVVTTMPVRWMLED